MEYRVGRFTLQPHKQLLDQGTRIPLGRKALDLLSVLAKADGAIVSKDELMEAVWPGVIVEENAIQVHMATIRRALGEAAEAIVTVRGIGYQLDATSVASTTTTLSASAIAVGHEPLLAVLSFENQSPDPDLSYFAVGVSEEILLAVSRLSGLNVIARSSSFQMIGESRRPAAIRVALGCTHILDGSVRREGNRVRIVAQLVGAENEITLWSDRFEGLLEDIFALQDTIASRIASALQIQFERRPAERRVHPAAFDLYLQARHWEGGPPNKEISGRKIPLYKRALEIDPGFAEAWAALAFTKSLLARFDESAAPYIELAAEAREAASRALALDPGSSGAQLALSILEPVASYGLRERFLEAALFSRPNDPEALRQFGEFATTVGRMRDCAVVAGHCWRLDPLNPFTLDLYARSLMETGSLPEALETWQVGRRRWPDAWWFLFGPLLVTASNGDWEAYDALTAEADPKISQIAFVLGVGHSLRYPNDDIREQILARAEAGLSGKGTVDLSMLMFLDALGLREQLFSLVHRATFPFVFSVDARHRDGVGFSRGIIFSQTARAMRSDPRFLELCGKLGLCAYWVETGRWPDCADEVGYDFRSEAKAFLARG